MKQDTKSSRTELEQERSKREEAVKATRDAESSKTGKKREKADATEKLVVEEKKKKDEAMSKLGNIESKVAELTVEQDAAYKEGTFAFLFIAWLKHLCMDFSFMGNEYAAQVMEWATDLVIREDRLTKHEEEKVRRASECSTISAPKGAENSKLVIQ